MTAEHTELEEPALADVDPDYGEGMTDTEEDERFRRKVELEEEPATMPATARELRAELEILERYDTRRRFAGHDYGKGQRYAELARRESELAYEQRWEEPTADELAAAFERVARPRIARIEAEHYRRETPATRRTLDTWRQLERLYAGKEG